MKRNNKIIGLISVLLITLVLTGCGKEIEVKNGSKVAVSVSKNKFTATEYYEKIKKENISVLIDMIDKSLLEKTYKTGDEETKSINNQIDQIKSYSGDNEDTYKQMLKQYFGVESEAELKEKLSLEYKRKLAVVDYLKDNLKDDEIKKYYEESVYGEVKASHILITVDAKEDATEEEKEEADKKALETAKKVIKSLEEGKSFKSLAKKYSKDEATASNGGDLGYFELDTMTEKFSNALKELKKDEYTKEPIKTEYGYHIILKTDEKEKPSLDDKKDDIKEKLANQKLNNDSAIYYEALIGYREKNKISWNDDVLKKAYDDYMNNLIENAKNNQ